MFEMLLFQENLDHLVKVIWELDSLVFEFNQLGSLLEVNDLQGF